MTHIPMIDWNVVFKGSNVRRMIYHPLLFSPGLTGSVLPRKYLQKPLHSSFSSGNVEQLGFTKPYSFNFKTHCISFNHGQNSFIQANGTKEWYINGRHKNLIIVFLSN